MLGPVYLHAQLIETLEDCRDLLRLPSRVKQVSKFGLWQFGWNQSLFDRFVAKFRAWVLEHRVEPLVACRFIALGQPTKYRVTGFGIFARIAKECFQFRGRRWRFLLSRVCKADEPVLAQRRGAFHRPQSRNAQQVLATSKFSCSPRSNCQTRFISGLDLAKNLQLLRCDVRLCHRKEPKQCESR